MGLAALLLLGSGCGDRLTNRENVFYYNEASGIASLDPAFAKNQSVIWPVHQLYSTLVETDSLLRIVPLLATDWELSDNRLEYRFHLRPDVFFHDNAAFPNGRGRKLVAADIVFSFQRLIDPATASPGAWIFNNRVAAVQPFEAPDDSTFVLRLQHPFSPILGVLSNPYCSILPREVVEKYGKDFRSHPCGTGPFQFKSWEEGQALILHRNPRYFERDAQGGQLPYLEAIKVSFFDSRATEFLMFRQQQLDFINDIDPSFKDEVLNKQGMLKKSWTGKIVLQKQPYLNTEYLGILVDSSLPAMKNAPLRHLAIRQAINYGFDREKMMLYLRNSIGTPALSGFVPAGLPSFDPIAVKGYGYDPNRARQLIRSAGYSATRPVPPFTLLTIPVYADLGSYIARQLEEIGLQVQVEVIPKGLLLEQMANGSALFFRGSWIADYPDAENYLSVFYNQNPAPPNYTRYKNPRFDQLYEAARLEEKDSLRYLLYQEMDRLIMADAPIVPLWYDQAIHLLSPRLKQFTANSLNLLELRRCSKHP